MKLLNLIAQDYTLIYKGRFFTTEEHDSLVIDPKKQMFFWNSKGIFGDALGYLRNVRNLDLGDALQILNQTSNSFEGKILEIKPEVPNPALVDIFFEYGRTNRDYWYEKRGYTDATVEKWKLGYTGNYHVIPIFQNGKFVNFQQRGIDLYGNKISKPFYSGGESFLFNIDNLPQDKSIPVYIGESPAEAIILAQNGFVSVGLPYGAMSWEVEWSKLFFDYESVYFCFDNDLAGRKGAKRASQLLQHNSYILEWPKGIPDKFDCTDLFRAGKELKREWFIPSYIFQKGS